MRRAALALLLALAAPAQAAQPISTTFYVRSGKLPSCLVHRAPWVQLALSPDLKRLYPCGTRLSLTFHSPLGGRRVIEGVVTDATGEKARNTVDVLVPTRAEALRYGRVRATLRRLP